MYGAILKSDAGRKLRGILGVYWLGVVLAPLLGGRALGATPAAPDAECQAGLAAFSLSPDGRRIAALAAAAGQDCGTRRILIAGVSTHAPNSTEIGRGRNLSQLHWVDDSDIAFIQGQDGHDVYEENIHTKRVSKIAGAPGTIIDYSISPDGSEILYTYDIPQKSADWVSERVSDRQSVLLLAFSGSDQVNGKFTGNGAGGTGIAVVRIGVGADVVRRVVYANVYQLGWYSEPNRPLVLLQASPASIWETSIVDVLTGHVLVGPQKLSLIGSAAGAASGLVAVTAAGVPNAMLTRPSSRQHLYVIGATSQVRHVRGLSARDVFGMWWAGNRVIWVEELHPDLPLGIGDGRLLEIDWKTDRIIRSIVVPRGNLSRCQLDSRRTIAVCMSESLTTSPRLVQVQLATGAVTPLGLEELPVEKLGLRFERILVRNTFGQVTSGFLAVPRWQDRRGARPSDAVPLAILLYGFNNSFAKDGQWIGVYPVSAMVHAGIAVLLLNLPEEQPWRVGDTRAARFLTLTGPLATLESAPAAVTKTGVRVGKVMVMGWSFGGFIASHAIEDSCRFVAAELGDPASWNMVSYALYNSAWRNWANQLFGGPPDDRYIENYLAFDPMHSGATPNGPVLLEFVSRNTDAGEYLEEMRADGAYVEPFAYHHSSHVLTVPAEARISRMRNLAWAKINLLGPQSVSAETLERTGLTVPPPRAYTCNHATGDK